MLVPVQHPTTRKVYRIDVPTTRVTDVWHIESLKAQNDVACAVLKLPASANVPPHDTGVVYAPLGMIAGWLHSKKAAVALAKQLAAIYNGSDMASIDHDTRRRMAEAICTACDMPMPRHFTGALTAVPQ